MVADLFPKNKAMGEDIVEVKDCALLLRWVRFPQK